MQDAITFEKAGKPTALIATDAFVVTAKAIARIQGMPDYPFAVLRHPLTSLEGANLEARAKEALPQVLGVLLAQR